MSVLLKLAFSFLQIGLFSIGGGYATISLIQQIIVTENQWLTIKEFTDIITISQMTPGPLAVNSSTFVGLRIGGLPGAIVATVCTVITGCLISLFLHRFFQKKQDSRLIQYIFNGLEAVAVGLIASASISILSIAFFGNLSFDFTEGAINFLAVPVFLLSFFCLRKWRINPMFILIATGILGLLLYR
ncbi:chromate transporter [Enterococcus sp. LJL98]